jgi:peroxiredoxin
MAETRSTLLDWDDDMSALVAGLRGAGAGSGGVEVGAAFPDFALPDAAGRLIRLAELRQPPGQAAPRPLVISLQRGLWCPFCRKEPAAWAGVQPRLAAAGIGFAGITPEAGGRAAAMVGYKDAGFNVVADLDLGFSLQLGLAIHPGAAMLERYKAAGDDIIDSNGGTKQLTIPATFLTDANGIIRFRYADPDFWTLRGAWRAGSQCQARPGSAGAGWPCRWCEAAHRAPAPWQFAPL